MKKLLTISGLALVFLAGANRYAQADPLVLNGGLKPNPPIPIFKDPPPPPPGPHRPTPNVTPEIDPGLAWSGVAFLAGSLLVLGSRRRKAATL